MKRISSIQLKLTMLQLLEEVGLDENDREIVAESLLQADLRGVNSHGIMRLPLYLRRIHAGVVNKCPQIKVIKDTLATALVDGDHGLGQLSGQKAMLLAIEKAEKCGIGAVSVQKGHHFGAGAYYAALAGEKDMIGIALTNTPPLMAPWGGKTSMVGNNPIAVYIPAGKELPIILDMAFSQVAQGKISLAAANNQEIPVDWALDVDGNPTNDPYSALKGLLLPVGCYKGYGQALIIDLLTGVLAGGSFGMNVTSMSSQPFKSQNSGQTYIAINIAAFRDVNEFKDDVDTYINEIKSSERINKDEQIYLPGEHSWHRYKKNLSEGIELPDGIFDELNEVAQLLGLEELAVLEDLENIED